jgi:hypothetical protein
MVKSVVLYFPEADMPIDQFTRAYFALHKVLDDASLELGLGRRAAVVLMILSEAPNGQKRTKEVVETFQDWFVSARNTAAKDVSIAKGELFQKDLIVARHGIRNIQLTTNGTNRAAELIAAIERRLENLVATHQDLQIIGDALSAIKPKKAERARSSIDLPKKPISSARPKRNAKHSA